MDTFNLKAPLQAVGELLARGNAVVAIVVVGGTALNLQGFVSRTLAYSLAAGWWPLDWPGWATRSHLPQALRSRGRWSNEPALHRPSRTEAYGGRTSSGRRVDQDAGSISADV